MDWEPTARYGLSAFLAFTGLVLFGKGERIIGTISLIYPIALLVVEAFPRKQEVYHFSEDESINLENFPPASNLWYVKSPLNFRTEAKKCKNLETTQDFSLTEDSLEIELGKKNCQLITETKPEDHEMPGSPEQWQGLKLYFKDMNKNYLEAKIGLDFDSSDVKDGYFALKATGKYFHYNIGIDKKGKKVFLHIWNLSPFFYDKAGREVPLGDLFGEGTIWVKLSLEWTKNGLLWEIDQIDGPSKEGRVNILSETSNGNIWKEELKFVSQDGVKEYFLDIGSRVTGSEIKYIKGKAEYVKTSVPKGALPHEFLRWVTRSKIWEVLFG